ncbi:molybdenum ABC transporter ATP-binding protein [uncultured Roseobacter sp.]|uniref:molybdenum ABC transporter ATP-binding protein n=1 Tax=uncultured Roseobacter sp. TaxID=114847 RepID=UPI0026112177|nr:molybdenum ABC transporter ATP-binding protein [uncultured Roseobacter sp.]
MLSVRVTQTFCEFTLDAAFEAPRGITVLYGRSGTGKTSIINAVAGLLNTASGRVTIGDRVLFDTEQGIWVPPHKRRVGYIFQEGRLFPHLTVRQNLLYGRRFAPRTAAPESPDRVIEMLGIHHLLDRRPALLSGGEKQRVAIGRALLASPEIILADEPLAALDDARKSDILPYFERIRDEVSVPVLYVSHSASEVTRLATTVIALESGRVTGQGPALQILSDPAVMPLGVRSAGAMLNATLVRHHDDGISELSAGGLPLLLPRVDHPPGRALRIRIEAQDVMLATRPPTGISALNVLPATLTDLRQGDGPGVLARLDAGGNTLLARITRRSCDALDLRPGMQVYAVIKAVSVPRDAVGDGHGSDGR